MRVDHPWDGTGVVGGERFQSHGWSVSVAVSLERARRKLDKSTNAENKGQGQGSKKDEF